MTRPIVIEFNAAYSYVPTAQLAVRVAIAKVHGSAFADLFMQEHREAVVRAARTRLCGRTESDLHAEAVWLALHFNAA